MPEIEMSEMGEIEPVVNNSEKSANDIKAELSSNFKNGNVDECIENITQLGKKKEPLGPLPISLLLSRSYNTNGVNTTEDQEKNQKTVLSYLLNMKHLCPTIEKKNGEIVYNIPDKTFESFANDIQLNPKVKAWHVANRADVAGKMSSKFKSYPSGESATYSNEYISTIGDYKGGKGRKTRRSKRSKRTKRSKQSKKRRSTRRR
jgi:hypothetical protein